MFWANLRKHATEIIKYENEEMLPLTDGEIESYNNKKFCHICKKKFDDDDDDSHGRDDDSNDDSDDKRFDTRKFYGGAVVLDGVQEGYFDHDDDDSVDDSEDGKFDARIW